MEVEFEDPEGRRRGSKGSKVWEKWGSVDYRDEVMEQLSRTKRDGSDASFPPETIRKVRGLQYESSL